MPARGSSHPHPSSILASVLAAAVVAAAVLTAAVPLRADTLVMQDGRRVHGRLVSVTRGWVEFQPWEGEDPVDALRVAVAEVRAIQFDDGQGRSDVDPLSLPGDRGRRRVEGPAGGRRGRMITVEAPSRWTDTGVDVTAGDIVSFSVAGTVTLGDDRPLGADGDLDGATPAPRRPLPDRPAGALIGRIGTSPDDTFFIGTERLPFRVRTSGRLYLGVNDDTLDDDTGAFQVSITR